VSQDVQVKNEGGRIVSSVQLKGANENGFLVVKLLFQDEPVEAVKVGFATNNSDASIIGSAVTDKDGIAKLTDKDKANTQVEVGNYWCKIENQPWSQISTVWDTSKPYVVMLPIGRPYYRILGGPS